MAGADAFFVGFLAGEKPNAEGQQDGCDNHTQQGEDDGGKRGVRIAAILPMQNALAKPAGANEAKDAGTGYHRKNCQPPGFVFAIHGAMWFIDRYPASAGYIGEKRSDSWA
jgi:hypothetical protein